MQKKKQKEEKERSALEDQVKKAKEAERKRAVEEEEQRKVARAKQAREEQAKAKYAEEFAAARQRIESQRAGAESYSAFREARSREREPSYSRPTYDPSSGRPSHTRTSTSETDNSPDSGQSRNNSPGQSRNNSPGHSRPSSMYNPLSDSRRPSVVQVQGPSSYHTSVEDLNARRGRRKSTMASALANGYPRSDASGSRASLPRSNSSPVATFMYPTFVYTNVPIPPVPQMPWGMPLLPPTPAFMLDSYPPSPASTPSREPSPSRQHFAGMPMATGNYYGAPQMPALVVPRQQINGENEAKARRASIREASVGSHSRTSYVLPASHSSRELRPQHVPGPTTKLNVNRRTSFA